MTSKISGTALVKLLHLDSRSCPKMALFANRVLLRAPATANNNDGV